MNLTDKDFATSEILLHTLVSKELTEMEVVSFQAESCTLSFLITESMELQSTSYTNLSDSSIATSMECSPTKITCKSSYHARITSLETLPSTDHPTELADTNTFQETLSSLWLRSSKEKSIFKEDSTHSRETLKLDMTSLL